MNEFDMLMKRNNINYGNNSGDGEGINGRGTANMQAAYWKEWFITFNLLLIFHNFFSFWKVEACFIFYLKVKPSKIVIYNHFKKKKQTNNRLKKIRHFFFLFCEK